MKNRTNHSYCSSSELNKIPPDSSWQEYASHSEDTKRRAGAGIWLVVKTPVKTPLPIMEAFRIWCQDPASDASFLPAQTQRGTGADFCHPHGAWVKFSAPGFCQIGFWQLGTFIFLSLISFSLSFFLSVSISLTLKKRKKKKRKEKGQSSKIRTGKERIYFI